MLTAKPASKREAAALSVGWAMQLDLDDVETRALLNLLTEAIENDRYPLPPPIRMLWLILAKFGPMAPAPPPARPPTPEERALG